MKKTVLLVGMITTTFLTYAQTEEDALRYSQTTVLGTARAQGLGGAMGAVGADFSSTQINPAGLGLYRRNEVHLSSAITWENADATYIGTTQNDRRGNFNIPSLGGVFTKVFSDMGEDRDKGLVSVSFATGLNRTANFQQNVYTSGTNTQSSILDYFVQQANGKQTSQLEDTYNGNDPAAMAWRTFLLDTVAGSSSQYLSWISNDPAFQLRQATQTSTRGAMYEYNLSMGANFSNWIYLGAGLVISNVNRESNITFSENVVDNSVNEYRSVTYKQSVTTNGSGASGRFGIILRPLDFIRLGGSVQTPTRLYLRDDYQNTMSVQYATQPMQYLKGPEDYIEYQLVTPAKYNLSAALISADYGLISVDVDMIDYSATTYKSDNFMTYFDPVNDKIKANYKQTYNVRVGAEAKIADIYRLRAGFVQYGSPYKAIAGVKESDLIRYGYSIGAGIAYDQFFIDFSTVRTSGNNYYTPYALNDINRETYTAKNNFSNYNFVLTGGIRF